MFSLQAQSGIQQPVATVVAASIAAFVAIAGWFVAKWRDDKTRRVELDLKYMGRQIEEFYGPLFNLVNQIFAAESIQRRLLEDDEERPRAIEPQAKQQIEDFFWQEAFLPLHQQIIDVMKTKLHLIDSAEIPASFEKYLDHSWQQKAQVALWQQHNINTAYLQGTEWPEHFYTDIELGLKRVLRRYESSLHFLR